MTIIKTKTKCKITNVGEGVEKWEPCVLLAGLENNRASGENSMVVPQKVKHRTTTWSGNPTSRYVPQRSASRNLSRYLYIHVHSSALFIIAKRCEQPSCASAAEWINKMWSLHSTEYYSAIKRKDILIHFLIGENPGDVK